MRSPPPSPILTPPYERTHTPLPPRLFPSPQSLFAPLPIPLTAHTRAPSHRPACEIRGKPGDLHRDAAAHKLAGRRGLLGWKGKLGSAEARSVERITCDGWVCVCLCGRGEVGNWEEWRLEARRGKRVRRWRCRREHELGSWEGLGIGWKRG